MSIMNLLEQLTEATGNEFEDKFCKIMKEIHKDKLQQTQVYGGDMKADAVLLPGKKTVFAVHGPETFKEAKVLEKLKYDYEGFIEHKQQGKWKAITKWIFVVRSERKGITSKILDFISSRDGENGVETGIWGLDDIRKYVMEWAPPALSGEILEEFKSLLLSLKQGGEVLTQDYEENGDRFFHHVEMRFKTPENREEACKYITSLIEKIHGVFIQYPGAFEDMGLHKRINKLVKLRPHTITVVDLNKAYESLCKKSKDGKYVLLKQTKKILERLSVTA